MHAGSVSPTSSQTSIEGLQRTINAPPLSRLAVLPGPPETRPSQPYEHGEPSPGVCVECPEPQVHFDPTTGADAGQPMKYAQDNTWNFPLTQLNRSSHAALQESRKEQ